MGSVWSRLGSKVTVVEFLDRVCPSMDQEITKAFTRVLKKQGLKFKFKTKVSRCGARLCTPYDKIEEPTLLRVPHLLPHLLTCLLFLCGDDLEVPKFCGTCGTRDRFSVAGSISCLENSG